jgi:hypothetical protein
MIVRTLLFKPKRRGRWRQSHLLGLSLSHYLLQCRAGWHILNPTTLDSDTISNEFLTDGTNSHKNAVVAVCASTQGISGLQGFKPLASEVTQVSARPPSSAACARNRAHLVLQGVHLQVLYLGDIRPAPTVDPPPPCGPARGAPTAAQPSPE